MNRARVAMTDAAPETGPLRGTACLDFAAQAVERALDAGRAGDPPELAGRAVQEAVAGGALVRLLAVPPSN